MDDGRREAADKAYMDYDFGDGVEVEDASGWEYTSLGREWTRAAFVVTDQGDTSGTATTKLTFTVRFTHGTDEIEEVYAIDAKGCIWGATPLPVDLAHVRLVVDSSYQCDPKDVVFVKESIQRELERAVAAGLLSADHLTPNGWEVKLYSVGKAAMQIVEEEMRDWLASTLESGNMRLEDVPKQLARYAMSDPFEMRCELAERMGRAD